MGEKYKITKDTKITVFSGAGISAESEIPTFRGPDGLWQNEDFMKIATPHGFLADPERSWRFYNDRRGNMMKAVPNDAHKVFGALEKAGYDVVVVTQNIDRLHHRGGSTKVLELHGTVWELKCSDPYCPTEPFENTDNPIKEIPPKCEICGSVLRPNVVFFEEMLDPEVLNAAEQRSKESDIFLVIGTSGLVYPAAGLVYVAKASGGYLMEFNIAETPVSRMCDETIQGPCGEMLPGVIMEMTGGEFKYP